MVAAEWGPVGGFLRALSVVLASRWAGLGEWGLRRLEVVIRMPLASLGGGLDLGAPVNIVRMGEGLGQGGSVTRGRGCLNCGLFEGNLGDYGGRMGRLLATKGA